MPIFEYRCRNCQEVFELLLLRRNEQPHCPQCGSADLEKLFSGFSVSAPAPKCPSGGSCPGAHQCGSGCCHG